jgi:hypothetical protein
MGGRLVGMVNGRIVTIRLHGAIRVFGNHTVLVNTHNAQQKVTRSDDHPLFNYPEIRVITPTVSLSLPPSVAENGSPFQIWFLYNTCRGSLGSGGDGGCEQLGCAYVFRLCIPKPRLIAPSWKPAVQSAVPGTLEDRILYASGLAFGRPAAQFWFETSLANDNPGSGRYYLLLLLPS